MNDSTVLPLKILNTCSWFPWELEFSKKARMNCFYSSITLSAHKNIGIDGSTVLSLNILNIGRRRFPWELESSKTAKMRERELDEEADMNLPTKRTAKTESRFTKNKPKDIDELEKEEAKDRAEKVADLGKVMSLWNRYTHLSRGSLLNHGEQRRMISVDNVFVFLR